MIRRFCAYTTLRNLRPFEPFFVLYLLEGLQLSYAAVGGVLAFERVLTGLLEVPFAALTDRFGRRRGLIAMFLSNACAFAIFAASIWAEERLLVVLLGQLVFGVGEALRTGTHKAIMLDWLDGRGEIDRATAVVGLTRVFSKSSGGLAALIGGALVYATRGFASLFWLSAGASLAGALLVSTYPQALEGEWTRDERSEQATPPSLLSRILSLRSLPGLLALASGSVLFEAQIKLGLAYLQPYLAQSAEALGLGVVGSLGALGIGIYYLVQGLAAGASSSLSAPAVRSLGGRGPALRLIHALAWASLTIAALSLWCDQLWPGLVAMLFLACLQNLRRPIFVAELNALTDPYLRATTLSLESQARSWLFAGLAVGTGLLADAWGLPLVFGLLATLMACSLAALSRARSSQGRAAPGEDP